MDLSESLDKTGDITIYKRLTYYNLLFNYIEDKQDFNLNRIDLQKVIFIIKNKLSKHYSKTKGRGGLLYTVVSVLNLT